MTDILRHGIPALQHLTVKAMSQHQTIRLYRTLLCVLPVALYGSECWTDTNRD